MSLQQSWFRGSVRIELLYRVSQALRRCHCTIVGSAGVLALSFCIVFHKLCVDVTATKLVPRECPYLAFVLCFTRFEVMSLQQSWFRGSARIEVPYCFYALCGDVTATKLVPRYCGIQTLCCVLHAMRRYHCNKVGCAALRN